jgi:metal-responsive CopG/Arc/MetJ family transcriptional regulator
MEDQIMSIRTVKVAISLPKETMSQIESVRHELKLPRSRAILEAVSLWLQKKKDENLDRKYIQGYKKKPEDSKEIYPLYKAGLSSFGKDDW